MKAVYTEPANFVSYVAVVDLAVFMPVLNILLGTGFLDECAYNIRCEWIHIHRLQATVKAQVTGITGFYVDIAGAIIYGQLQKIVENIYGFGHGN